MSCPSKRLSGLALVLRQIHKMREEIGDLHDYLDLLEARAVNEGKGTYSTDEVKAKLGLK